MPSSFATDNRRMHAANGRVARRTGGRLTGADQRGTTLIEFIIYIGVVGFVLSAAVMFAGEFVLTQAKGAATMETARNARFAAARVAVAVREANSLDTGGSDFGTNPGTLSLCANATCAAATDKIVFTVTGGRLTMNAGTGAVPLTSSKVNVTDFTVDDVSTGVKTQAVRIHVVTEYAASGDLVEFNASSTGDTTAKVNKDHGFGP